MSAADERIAILEGDIQVVRHDVYALRTRARAHTHIHRSIQREGEREPVIYRFVLAIAAGPAGEAACCRP